MKVTLLLFCALLTGSVAWGQKKEKFDLNLNNALVIGQFDDPQDRYIIEIAATELFSANGVKTTPSLNILKLGQGADGLLLDSIQAQVSSKNIDTYVLISVRGYDKKYKPSTSFPTLAEAIDGGNIYSLYQADVVSVSFEFRFFRGGKCVYNDIVKCGSVGDREGVIKKFRKKVAKRLVKHWM